MKIETEKSLATLLKPEFAERRVALSQRETEILKKAIAICEKAQELESEINRLAGDGDDRWESEFGWAEIYLKSILRG